MPSVPFKWKTYCEGKEHYPRYALYRIVTVGGEDVHACRACFKDFRSKNQVLKFDQIRRNTK